MTEEEFFGRQPQQVAVLISGTDKLDVEYWTRDLMRRAEFKGDIVDRLRDVQHIGGYAKQFTIYPRAVND